MRPYPIFDTNVFGDVQRGLIPQSDWEYALRRRPTHGWPLSNITALELLAGVDATPPQHFLDVRERVKLAFELSKGRILEDPRVLICREVLGAPFPPDLLPPSASVASKYMDIVRRADSFSALLNGRVLYRGRFGGFRTTAVLGDLMAGPKKQWVNAVQGMATEKYPQWRELFAQTGRRLPLEMRKEVESQVVSQVQRGVFVEGLLSWLGENAPTAETVSDLITRLDAVLEFTIFVVREFLLRNYSPEKNESDVYDQFQLQYLAMDRFDIVSGDRDLSVRTVHSSQADRIMSFHDFLQSL